MRARLAPALALLFFTAACALTVADAYAPGLLKWAIVALAFSNAAILWAYYGADTLHPLRHGTHAAPPPGRRAK